MWNKFDGFHYLLEVKVEAHDHEADRSDFEGTYYKLKSDMEGYYHHRRQGPWW
jgi:hypothetical protein